MAINFPIPAYFVAMVFINRLKSYLAKSKAWINFLPTTLFVADHELAVATNLSHDPEALSSAALDFGHMVSHPPAAVLFPSSINDVVNLLKLANSSPVPFNVAAKGCGHSVRGQAMARNGVVIEMTSLNNKNSTRIVVSGSPSAGYFVDVGGEQLWIDVLNATLEHGLAPVSWTDYLYLTVGGTLSNAGISGQTFRYGPQISNVVELDVITGKGDLVSCSAEKNNELFHSVLGGLGQFGIIVRARIPIFPAPNRVKWVRMLYNNFSEFAKDQEQLISMNGRKQKGALDYLEGLLLMHDGPPDNWRSSFFPPSHHSTIISLVNQHSIIYCLEVAKFYDDRSRDTVDKELDDLFQGLNFLHGYKFEKDVSYPEFLNRVRSGELSLQSQGLWDVPHPWLNLFVPKSRIEDFDSGVFKDIVLKGKITKGPVLVYPMNRSKWDDKMSAMIPNDQEVFYTIGFLNSSGFDDWEAMDEQNKEILRFCNSVDMKIKQYLPHYKTKEDWENHFGPKWRKIQDRKKEFDPKMILSPGQKIFNP